MFQSFTIWSGPKLNLDLTCFTRYNLDNGFESRIVHIEFSAASDLVNHKALICKLQNIIIGGYIL